MLRFLVSTGFSAAMSFGLPVALHELANAPKTTAVAIGFVTAYLGNILLLRLYVFRSSGSWLHQMSRYIPTNGFFRLCEYFAVVGLFQHLGVDYRVAILLVLATSSIIKFFAYRLIFGHRSDRARSAAELQVSDPLER
ncbi:hypothetical protein GRI58_11180 [Porphyrobacter algicida]|uniref:GtrA/DPMS transmembrane domain-containing protein n=2 Tax=Qipengyuania algicida TaxID=1836209 RepID=A0A845AKK9_9SPHN|nr:hypothetical protein [Qipengyuania algicida]